MIAENELQGCQQKNQTNIGDNLNQVLARVEQALAKIETVISRRVAASAAAAASSPPPPTSNLEHGKNLNPAEIVQPDRESVASENIEIDIKCKNHQVSKLKDSFMLAIKSNIAEIGDEVLNLSTNHAIIKQHLVDTESKLPLSQNCFVLLVIKKSCVIVLLLYICHN